MKDLSLNDKTLKEVKQVKEMISDIIIDQDSLSDEVKALEHVLVYLNNHIMFLEWKETK